MASFSYTAVDEKSSYIKGKIDARSESNAVSKLEKEGFLVVNVKRDQGRALNITLFESISTLDKIFLTRNLLTMLEAGIPLDQAVHITAEQTTNRHLKELLEDISKRLQDGQQFHTCLARYPKYFSTFYVNLVRVGESSGKLDEVLTYLLEQQERDNDLKTKMRSAMVYPSIIITALIVMVTFMMVFVIPRITSVLTQYKVSLPLATRILMGTSHFVIHDGFYLLAGLIVVVLIMRRVLRTKAGKYRWESFVLKLPGIKTIVIEFNLARFARSLAALLKSGISIDQALDLTAGVTGNSHYSKTIRDGIPFIQRGIPLAEVLKGNRKLFTPLAARMVEVGERTGKLDHMVDRVAVFYERSVSNTLGNLSSVIEPVLLLGIGLSVGFMAVAVLTPIWKFSETV